VLLMRHCQHFPLYFEKLVSAGCRRLITNARWRSGVEAIDLAAPRIRYCDLKMGWYACSCGATGFKTGPVEWITPENVDFIDEVIHCPNCDRA
jgi:hypothetical protein